MSFWELVSWVSTATAITAYAFNIKKNKVCFILWEVAAVGLILSNLFGTKDYGQMSLNAVYFWFNIYGWLEWSGKWNILMFYLKRYLKK